MTTETQVQPLPEVAPRDSLIDKFQAVLPKLVLSPSVLITLIFTYGFILWSLVLSFTNSRMLPSYDWVGLSNYSKLFSMERWTVAYTNLFIFGVLFILIAITVGTLLAILLDQKIRAEGALRTIYLYPFALSLIVTGTAWKWILNPEIGIEKLMHDFGFTSFQFDWLVDKDMAIYTIVIAAVWQASGFVMAIMLAGLRGVDGSIIKAAQIDGATMPTIYRRIILPMMRPIFFSCFIILSHLAIKSFDLVVVLTSGGPGYASDLPATFMYQHAFGRNQIGIGSASAMITLMGFIAILIPYLYSELRKKKHG
ncbi:MULTISPECIES: carbohydrate ABC transporter permease [unclassified Photobacterium]|uniref:carbohydrate ABC transporter permease n=1 Tax=unclassified Photobacterium TaxID=2628852 RepID=UPI001B8C0191|nr:MULTISPECIES: sugar ABC transporter permease [unclassified Photobacterium]MDO6707423.1 sugar ABC transporter permease [Photobacterium sp. 1_MG-2023]QUJ67556.1 sugar ABC transporter permease [Photobacterium sp. GJ3]